MGPFAVKEAFDGATVHVEPYDRLDDAQVLGLEDGQRTVQPARIKFPVKLYGHYFDSKWITTKTILLQNAPT